MKGNIDLSMYVIHIFEDEETLDYIDFDDEPWMATENDDVDTAIYVMESHNAILSKISQEERSDILTQLFGPKNPLVNQGTILLLDRSCVYLEKGFKANFFEDKYDKLKNAVSELTIDEFTSFSEKLVDITSSINNDSNLKVAYNRQLLDFETFLKLIKEDKEYYVGYVFSYEYAY